jgi:hypothetical protein
MKQVLILFLVIAFLNRGTEISAQVINVEDERIITDTTGWAGTAKVSFDYAKSTKELWKTGSNLHLQYKTQKSLYLCLGEYRITKASGTDFENSGVFHLRYNYKFLDRITGELFTQIQFNKLLKVDQRWLTGAGPRFKMAGGEKFRLYTAALYMYEYEELKEFQTYNRHHRISSYVSFSLKLNNQLRLTNTTYFQPRINEFADFRVSSHSSMMIKLSKHISYVVSYRYFYDKYPAPGIPNETHDFSNSLMLKF